MKKFKYNKMKSKEIWMLVRSSPFLRKLDCNAKAVFTAGEPAETFIAAKIDKCSPGRTWGVRQQRLQEINERSLGRGIRWRPVLLLKPQGARCDYPTNPKQSLILEEGEGSFDRERLDEGKESSSPSSEKRPVIIPDFGGAKKIVLTSKSNLRRANSSSS